MKYTGNIELEGRQPVFNPDGSISTVASVSFGSDGNYVLVPTVWDGDRHTPRAAWERYLDTGKHLGKASTLDAIKELAEFVHNLEAARIEREGLVNPLPLQRSTGVLGSGNPAQGLGLFDMLRYLLSNP